MAENLETTTDIFRAKNTFDLNLAVREAQLTIPRGVFIDLMRIIPIVFVVLLHISESVTNHWGRISQADWMIGNFYNSISRFAAPVLFMTSGYLLLDKEEKLQAFFVKRFRKIVIPLLGWSVIYLLLSQSYANYSLVNAIKSMVKTIISGPAYYHLWFLYALISIYILVPVLRVFIKNADPALTWYLTIFCLLSNTLVKPLEEMLGFDLGVNLRVMPEYMGMFLLGRQLGRMQWSKNWINLAWLVFIASTGYTIYETYLATAESGKLIGSYYSYNSINVRLAAISAFILLKKIGESNRILLHGPYIKLIKTMSAASFGIYLVHLVILGGLLNGDFGFKFTVFTLPPFFSIPLLAVMVLALSYLVVRIMQKIPILREIVP